MRAAKMVTAAWWAYCPNCGEGMISKKNSDPYSYLLDANCFNEEDILSCPTCGEQCKIPKKVFKK